MKNLLVVLALLLSGCASVDKNYAAALAAYQAAHASMATVTQEQIRALGKGMDSADPTARAVSAMALAQIRPQLMNLPNPPESDAYKWASLIVPTAGYLAMGYYNYRLGSIQSSNQRDIAVSTNNAFLGMGSAIASAGTAGYPYVQAPGPVTTTTNAYTNSYNTNRNCIGGAGAAGGAGDPAGFGGAGGLASC